LRIQGPDFRVQGSGCRNQGAGCKVQGSGFRVQGSGFRVQGSGFRVQGLGRRAWEATWGVPLALRTCVAPWGGGVPRATYSAGEGEFFIVNLLVRIHLIIEMTLLDRPCAVGV